MKLSEFLSDVKIDPAKDVDIQGLENDSRKIKSADAFIAYPGAMVDGRQFIPRAVDAGASAIIYDPQNGFVPDASAADIPVIAIENLAGRLAEIAHRFYLKGELLSLSITGVTGTNGKSSIASQLSQAYQLLGQKAVYAGTLGLGEYGHFQPLLNTTPDALMLQRLLADCQKKEVNHLVMEVSSHALAQHRVDYIPFQQAIFTNLSHEHLDYHGDMQHYAEAKAKLFSSAGLRWAIVNQDDPYSAAMRQAADKSVQHLTYAIDKPADIRPLDWHMDAEGSFAELDSPWGRKSIHLKTLGRFNLYNAMAVYASLLANDIPIDDVAAIMAELAPAAGRLEIVSRNPLVIVDYAHTPDALENVLMTLKAIAQGSLWLIFGCGGERDKSKRPLMGNIASQYADKLIISSDNPRREDPMAIIQEIASAVSLKDYEIEPDREQAIIQALSAAKKEDIILIAGKGHEDYQQLGLDKVPFSDQAVVRAYFSVVHST